jgi:hypothetical protein
MNCEGGPVTFTGNRVISRQTTRQAVRLIQLPGQSLKRYWWDGNSYYGPDPFFRGTQEGIDYPGFNMDFQGWKTSTKFDAESKRSPEPPGDTTVAIRRNKYEKGRANIVIYNWGGKESVEVDPGAGGLVEGDAYEVRDAQNYFGKPVAEGTWDGNAVAIPMTGLAKAAPVGLKAPAHTAPWFGTFVLMRKQ